LNGFSKFPIDRPGSQPQAGSLACPGVAGGGWRENLSTQPPPDD